MNKYILVVLLFSLSFCSRKKAIDQGNDTSTVISRSIQSTNKSSLWNELTPKQYGGAILTKKKMPKEFRVFSLDSLAMQINLSKSVKQNQWLNGNQTLMIPFPRPDSGFSSFSIYETSVMDSALAAHYPNMKTYGGKGITNAAESIRFDFNENGFNAYIIGPNGEWYIQPLVQGITHRYLLTFFKNDLTDSLKTPFELPDSLRK